MAYMYTLDYEGTDDPLLHAKIFVIADKYEVAGLGELATMRCGAAAEKTVMTSSPSFAETVDFIYANTLATHRGIRDAVLQAATANFGDLLKCASYTEMLDKNGEFAREVMQQHSGLTLGHGDEVKADVAKPATPPPRGRERFMSRSRSFEVVEEESISVSPERPPRVSGLPRRMRLLRRLRSPTDLHSASESDSDPDTYY